LCHEQRKVRGRAQFTNSDRLFFIQLYRCWKTFFRNHAQAIVAIDLFVVPTLTFERLFAFLVLGHGRRQLLCFEVTRHPTAEWLLGRSIIPFSL